MEDPHAAAAGPVIAARWNGVHETVSRLEAANRQWRPLLEQLSADDG